MIVENCWSPRSQFESLLIVVKHRGRTQRHVRSSARANGNTSNVEARDEVRREVVVVDATGLLVRGCTRVMVEQVVRARCSWWPWTLCWCSTSCSCFSCSSSGSPASCTTCRVLGRMLSRRTRSSRRERRRAMTHRSTMCKVGIRNVNTIAGRLRLCELFQQIAAP